jgi:3-oxoacyl-[acyl-carrier protein] reductase
MARMIDVFDLSGRVAIITGASSGIGAATARRFARAGAALVLSDYAPDAHDIGAVIKDITAIGGKVEVLNLDVRDTAAVNRLVDLAITSFGKLDIAIANAAIARIAPFGNMSEADFETTLDVDLTGVWRLFRAAVGPMAANGSGRLVATASTVGVLEAWNAHAHYAAAKAGIVGMVRSLAAELGPSGITVNAVAPGIIETPQTLDEVNSLGAKGLVATTRAQPIRRIGRPEDIAAAFQFLASEAGAFITGHTLVVDGGRTITR